MGALQDFFLVLGLYKLMYFDEILTGCSSIVQQCISEKAKAFYVRSADAKPKNAEEKAIFNAANFVSEL